MHVTATQLKNRLGQYMDTAMREPVIVEKSGRNKVVMLAYEDFIRFQTMEDAYWGKRALESEKDGEYVDGFDALNKIAKEKSIEVDTPII